MKKAELSFTPLYMYNILGFFPLVEKAFKVAIVSVVRTI